MKLLGRNIFRKKRRKYPIKRDNSGRSARERAFELFDKEMMPAEIKDELAISVKTARRYYADWKKQGENRKYRDKAFKSHLKECPEFREALVKAFSQHLGLSEKEVDLLLDKPWGQAQIEMGGWAMKIKHRYQDLIKLHLIGALRLIFLYEYSGMKIKDILQALLELLKAKKKY